MSAATVSFFWYAGFEHGGKPGRIAPHACPVRFEREAVDYNWIAYGQKPKEVRHGHRIRLDPGGMVMVKTPLVVVRLKGYTVGCKLDHVPVVHAVLRRKLEKRERVRLYSGEETMTIHGLAYSYVLPLADIPKIIRGLERRLAESEMALVKRDQDLSKVPNFQLVHKRPREQHSG